MANNVFSRQTPLAGGHQTFAGRRCIIIAIGSDGNDVTDDARLSRAGKPRTTTSQQTFHVRARSRARPFVVRNVALVGRGGRVRPGYGGEERSEQNDPICSTSIPGDSDECGISGSVGFGFYFRSFGSFFFRFSFFVFFSFFFFFSFFGDVRVFRRRARRVVHVLRAANR